MLRSISKFEYAKTFIMFTGRIIRGFVVPYFMDSSQYSLYLRIVSFFRFSHLSEFGLREWAISIYTKRQSLPKFQVLLLNLIFAIPAILLGYFFNLNILEILCVFIFWMSLNLKYITNNILAFNKDWKKLFEIELVGFIMLLLGIFVFIQIPTIELILSLEIILSLIIIVYFLLLIRKNQSAHFSIRIKRKLSTLKEFLVGNGESLLIILVNEEIRPTLGISFAFSGLFLYVSEFTSNKFVVSNQSLTQTVKLYSILSLIFLASYFILFLGPIQTIFPWAVFQISMPIGISLVLLSKLNYSVLRKEDLIGSKNRITILKYQNILTVLNVIILCWLFYLYS